LTCCFMQFLSELEIIFAYLALWVDFVISCTEKSKAIHVWLEQHCLIIAFIGRVVGYPGELESI